MTEYVTGSLPAVWAFDERSPVRVPINHAVRADTTRDGPAVCGEPKMERVDRDQPWNPRDRHACPVCRELVSENPCPRHYP